MISDKCLVKGCGRTKVHINPVCRMHWRRTPGPLKGVFLRFQLSGDNVARDAVGKDIVNWLNEHPEECGAEAK